MINRVVLVGRLAQDPELRYTQGGQAVLNLRLATTETFFNRDKERQQRTEWHTVVVWGRRGEALNKILSKGRSICVEGRIQTRRWEDRDGNKRYTTEIVATDVQFLGSRDAGDAGRPQGPPVPDYSGAPTQGPDDDDIPF